jgi:glycosyltransferase involved in cell wall biosynthesis
MRVAIASLDYPPAATEGIARQRQVLAEALVGLGHDVHVVTRGPHRETVIERGVQVHRYAAGDLVNDFLPSLPVLNRPLTDAQLLCEAVLDVARRQPVDVIDVPLWLAQPLALLPHAPCPVVIWLQTSLLQLVELQGRDVRPHEAVLAAIDRFGLTRAARCIADSASVLAEIERLYELAGLSSRTAIVHPGLAGDPADLDSHDSDGEQAPRRPSSCVEALVVGRLEQRKGTPLLFEALPRLLAAVPNLVVRCIGRDNSSADGFQRQTGRTYPEAFRAAHPELADRVLFDGYVDEATLARRYASADLLLHPALYESFGLIFLEAMRAGVPVVAFKTGGAIEVFGEHSSQGARLASAGDLTGWVEAAIALAHDPAERAAVGQAGRVRFTERFTSERMARETADVYAEVMQSWATAAAAATVATVATGVTAARRAARRTAEPRVYQVMEALMDRDAVSRIARTNAGLLAELGGERPILSLFAEPSVRSETGRVRAARFGPEDSAIFHYWGFSRLERLMLRFPGRKAIHYHNITPPHFFSPRSPHYEMTTRGYAQLDRIGSAFDLIIGDSEYNLRQYARHLTVPRPGLCLYPVVDPIGLRAAAWDREFAGRLNDAGRGPVWLFVGRLAPNKRQDMVMRAFDRFVALTGHGQLLLVGDNAAVPAYVEQLERLRTRLPNGSRITLTGSLADEQLRACYRVARLFACASEHEGFCVPLAEAMAFGIPAIALDRGAVGETLGDAGVLVREWDPQRVAETAAHLLEWPNRRAALERAQRARLAAFSPDAAHLRLRAIVAFLRDGVPLGTSSHSDSGLMELPGLAGRVKGETWSTSMH